MEVPFSFPFINGSRTKSSSERGQKLRLRKEPRQLFMFLFFACQNNFSLDSVCVLQCVRIFVFAITGVFTPAIPRVILADQLE